MTAPLPYINATSLLPHCRPCGSQCCRYSSPIISPDEKECIVASCGKDLFIEQSTPGGSYFVIGRTADGNLRQIDQRVEESSPCGYLASDGSCTIHQIKPLDCRAYPLRAIPSATAGEVEWRFHRVCPATSFIDNRFLPAVRIVALASLRRFTTETYMDWLYKYSPWALAPEAMFQLSE
uniref:Zinc- or iron-chelating domain-containing protein n=1 Tax=Candidatus Kentrum sp. SD TaxID=2126332 RepID=A0A450YV00_9GAMM|nr:MAG: Putative zinc- or iron-chelating domain-containing protein [Candidatus Kentron sp. SD]VFK45381.1 MAG: Putative zinc- or iron-chelating domain-containing protein [Candidatus Kentron sp. SD]VFK79537.1 MAG: Putative zinc- or iron-chelating domain-containing protein [Candidatus Kentron sp. SD]